MIRSQHAFIIYTVVMVGICVFTAFKPSVPFLAFATQFSLGFAAYLTKRVVKHNIDIKRENNENMD